MEQALVRAPLSTRTFTPAFSGSPLVKLTTPRHCVEKTCSHHRVRCSSSGDTSSSGGYSQIGELGARDPFVGKKDEVTLFISFFCLTFSMTGRRAEWGEGEKADFSSVQTVSFQLELQN